MKKVSKLPVTYAELDLGAGWTNQSTLKGGKSSMCHAQHPVLKLGGGELVGASCNYPREGFDIYVGFDWGMQRTSASYPWETDSKVIEVYFPVSDGTAPKDVVQFKKLVHWLAAQLSLGRRVHVGCIGGHGRTGTLIAALVSVIHENADAISWVREHYCKSAVETKEQVQFLVQHFGIKPVKGAKEWEHKKHVTHKDNWSPTVSGYAPLRGRSIWNDACAVVIVT